MKRLQEVQLRRAALQGEIAASRLAASVGAREMGKQAGAALLGLSVARLFGRKTLWRSLAGIAAGTLATALFRQFNRR